MRMGLNFHASSSPTYLARNIENGWKIVGTTDINGDGHPDIIWQSTQTGTVLVWYMMADVFIGGELLASGIPDGWKIISIQDIDGDGNPDLVWQNSQLGGVVYWLMNGANLKANGTIGVNVPANLVGVRAHLLQAKQQRISIPIINNTRHHKVPSLRMEALLQQ